MKRLMLFAPLCALLAACSFAPIRISVPGVVLPGNETMGLVCYAEVAESAPTRFTRASYRTTALYDSALPGGEVTVQVYGRTEPPDAPCVGLTDADILLSDPISLRAGEPQAIEVGGGAFGPALAGIIVRERYYLGATVSGGVLFSLEERITLEPGVILVSF